MSHESSVTTLKFPHVSFLSLAKRRFNKFFKQLTSEKLITILQEIIDKIYGQGKIVIVGIPELHKCHLKCHENKNGNHNIKNCHCRGENNEFIHHLCKRD